MVSYNLSADELKKLNPEIAIIPIGSTEQHGPHLPLSTDVLIGEAFSQRIAEKLNAFVTPVIPISNCREHMGKKGSVFMRPETCYAMLYDIVMSLKEQGFKKCVIFQSHGGIFVIPPLIRQINAELNPNFMLCKVEIMNLMEDAVSKGIVESGVYMHADEYETSVMLHIHPELVKMEKAVDCCPNVPREFLNYGSIFRFCPDGVWGKPSAASAEKGQKLLESGTEAAVKYIGEVFDFIDKKEKFGYSDF